MIRIFFVLLVGLATCVPTHTPAPPRRPGHALESYNGPPQDLGVRLNKSGASLTTSYTGGDSLQLRGTQAVEGECAVDFRGGTDLTDIRFRWEISDDADDWKPIAGVRASDGAVVRELVLLAADGDAKDILVTESHRASKYVRLAARRTGGSEGADVAAAVVRFIP